MAMLYLIHRVMMLFEVAHHLQIICTSVWRNACPRGLGGVYSLSMPATSRRPMPSLT
jgi:hypothetical protein